MDNFSVAKWVEGRLLWYHPHGWTHDRLGAFRTVLGYADALAREHGGVVGIAQLVEVEGVEKVIDTPAPNPQRT